MNWNTDKPGKVIVASDIQNRTYHLDERVDYDDGRWGEEWDVSHHDQHWSDGEGGGSWLESRLMADSESNGTLTNEYCAGEFNWSATSGMTVTEDTCAPKPVPYVYRGRRALAWNTAR